MLWSTVTATQGERPWLFLIILPAWKTIPSSIQALLGWHCYSLQPWVLSLHPVVSFLIFLAVAELVCARWALWGIQVPLIYLFYTLAYSLCTVVWIVMRFGLSSRLSKACFQLNKWKEWKQLQPLFALFSFPIPAGRMGKECILQVPKEFLIFVLSP